ncbi:HAD family hydrolase [Jeotgalicoccus sp. S0W5]|uniref:HAD family hydrolase n=1 Tax=Jeotgalicoccus sp. S0W5 TaxID=2527874 RepID=UPI0014150F79|nr:HAD family hydrolase [Jeotgalicoccus sp. S0W5]
MTSDVLVFDMDGTLYYSEDFIDTYINNLTVVESKRAEMLEDYKQIAEQFSMPDQKEFLYKEKALGDVWQILFYIADKYNISEEDNHQAFLKTREKMINNQEISINFELINTIKNLKLPKVLMTNSPEVSATPFIDYLNLNGDFDMYIFDAKKPVELRNHIEEIAKKFPGHNIIKIGDNYHNDIQASVDSGIDSIHINHFNQQTVHNITVYNLDQLNDYLVEKYMEV